MKRKIFLLAVALPCLLAGVTMAFAFNSKDSKDEEFVEKYYEFTSACLDYTNAAALSSPDTSTHKAVMVQKIEALHNVEGWEEKLSEAAENSFFGFPSFALHNPYSTCIYYCAKQFNDCYLTLSGPQAWDVCAGVLKDCNQGCKTTFLTGNP